MKDLIGNLLIAPPALNNGFFQQTVILLTEHYGNGSIGVLLNRPSTMTVREFAKQNNVLLNREGMVHIGGPVNVKALTMIHTNDWACANTMKINEDISISSSPEILTYMAMGKIPEHWRIFVGLCGWAKGQLQNELEGNKPLSKNLSWITAKSNTDIIFSKNEKKQWLESIELAGSQFAQNILI